MTPRRPCLEIGCAGFADPGVARCRPCRRAWRQDRWENPAYKAWGRPSGRCVLRILCNGAPATTWDHIDGDATNHRVENRQPACNRCNPSKGGRA